MPPKMGPERPHRLDFTFPVGTNGMTGMDLILTLVRELNKNGFAFAGIVVDIKNQDSAEFIGHGTEELIKEMFKKGVRMLEKGKIQVKDTFAGGSQQN